MDFEVELKKQNLNIRTCSVKSGIPYATLYPIIKGQVDLGTCAYNTVEKLARTLGYSTEEIVYKSEDFQTFRNNLHHEIKHDEVKTILEIIEQKDIEYYQYHRDYIKMLYLLATVDYISKKNKIPLCDQYDKLRKMKLEEPYFVGDSAHTGKDTSSGIAEFAKYNIVEEDL